jgi:zeta-carotene desaturase
MSAASVAGPATAAGRAGGAARRVVIVGGGLAGIAAAAALDAAGQQVTLLESRHALGGRASSFDDPQTAGQLLDNCQHVLLGCCTNLIDLYRRLGVEKKIRYERRVHFLDERGKGYDLWGVSGLPAPFHLGPAMVLFGLLSVGERMAVNRAMLAMLRMGVPGRNKLETMPFGDWLDEHRQPASVVEKFYDPVLISALNEETRRASAKYAIQVFQDALLAHKDGYLVGLPACPLGELYAKAPCADLRLSTRVGEIVFDGNRAKGVLLQNGERIDADVVVLATNHHAVQRWIPEHLQRTDARFAGLEKLESVPILGAHLWFDQPIMRESHAALVKGPLQWLFRKDAEGRVLHGVISASRQWVNVPKEESLRQFEAQVRSLFPAARNAKLVRGLIVIEKRATFSPSPGSDALRPEQAPAEGGVANLFLAGDYTKTEWPATMEGAVRSGYRAADAVLRYSAAGNKPFLVADLHVQWPGRLLSRRS